MTQASRFFDGVTAGYDRDQIAAVFKRLMGNGYFPGELNELEVYQHTAPNMIVNVKTGGCIIEGYHHFSDAVENLIIEAADVTNPRIDRIIARLTKTGSPGSIVLAVLKGTAATPAVAPALTRSGATYELSLAQVSVVVGTTAITTAMITDERDTDTVCGVARPIAAGKTAYADIAMGGFRVTGLADPASAQDADTLAARNAAILAKVPLQTSKTGLFLQTNGTTTLWNSPVSYVATAGDTLRASSDASKNSGAESAYVWMKTITVPLWIGGTFRVKFSLAGDSAAHEGYGRIYKNGVAFGTARTVTGTTPTEYSEDLAFAAGDTIEIWGYGHYQSWDAAAVVTNFRVYCIGTVIEPTWT